MDCGKHYNGRVYFYFQDTWRSLNLYWCKRGREKQNYLELTFLVTAVNSLLRIVRFTVNMEKKLDPENSFIAQMSLPEA